MFKPKLVFMKFLRHSSRLAAVEAKLRRLDQAVKYHRDAALLHRERGNTDKMNISLDLAIKMNHRCVRLMNVILHKKV